MRCHSIIYRWQRNINSCLIFHVFRDVICLSEWNNFVRHPSIPLPTMKKWNIRSISYFRCFHCTQPLSDCIEMLNQGFKQNYAWNIVKIYNDRDIDKFKSKEIHCLQVLHAMTTAAGRGFTQVIVDFVHVSGFNSCLEMTAGIILHCRHSGKITHYC